MAEASSSRDKICGICEEKQSKYCCPRCELLYCSLDCYKSEKHLTCSESFYRDCVNEELTFYEPDEDSKKMIKSMLKRMYKKNSSEDIDVDDEFVETMEGIDKIDSDDDEVVNLHQRLLCLDLDDTEAVWSALTNDEKNDFEAIVNNGDISSILPQWEPWWKYKWESNIVDVEEIETRKQEMLDRCPPVLVMPKLSTLTSAPVAPAVKYNMINVLGSYAFLARYFNGEMDPVETTVYLYEICANLDTNSNFDDTSVAIASIQQRCLQSQLINTDEDSLDVMSADVFLILQGPSSDYKAFYSKSALSHLHSILTEAKTATRSLKKENLHNIEDHNGTKENSKDTGNNTNNRTKEDANKNKSNTGTDSKNITSQTEDKKNNSNVTEDNMNNADGTVDSNDIKEKKKNINEFAKKFPDHKLQNLPKIDTNKVRKSLKKIEYYLSFLEDCVSRLHSSN